MAINCYKHIHVDHIKETKIYLEQQIILWDCVSVDIIFYSHDKYCDATYFFPTEFSESAFIYIDTYFLPFLGTVNY